MDLDSKLDNIFNDILNVKEENDNLIKWEEDPVTFREFLTSKEHLDFPEYSARQYDAIDALFGTEPKNTFFNDDACWLLLLIWGKGGFLKNKIIKDVITGEEHTVEEWSKLNKKIHIYAYNFHKNKKVITKINPFFKEGHGKIYKVKTKSGKVFYVDGEHKFYTDKFIWQKVKELKKGDKIGKLKDGK